MIGQGPKVPKLKEEKSSFKIELRKKCGRNLFIKFGAFEDTIPTTLLNQLLNPPPTDIVEENLSQLRRLGAISEENNMTALGKRLLQLPMDPQLGRLLLVTDLMGVLDAGIFIISCSEVGRLDINT